MAEKKTRRSAPAPRGKKKTSGRAPARRRPAAPSLLERIRSLPMFTPPEFRPDTAGTDLLKPLRFTRQQRQRLLRWILYVLVCLLCLVVQDTVMSKIRILGATTDLPAGIILLIGVLEGADVGGIFVLCASVFYYFSGSAPGPYTVGVMTVLGVAASLFRQRVWHRSAGSILLCTGVALLGYEIGMFIVGLSMHLTRWSRFPVFVVCALITGAVMIPMYHLVYRIGMIGGKTWKE